MISDFSAINADTLAKDVKLLEAVRESCHRILYTYVNSNAMNGVSSNSQVVSVTPWWKTALYTADAVIAVLALAGLIMYVISFRKTETGRERKVK